MRYDSSAPVGHQSVHVNGRHGAIAPVAGTAQAGRHSGLALSQSTAPYVGRGKKCAGDNDTCEGFKAKGTEFCIGHLRQQGLAK